MATTKAEASLEGLKADTFLIDDPTIEECNVVVDLLFHQLKKSITNGNPVGKIANLNRCSKYVHSLRERGGLNVFKSHYGTTIVGAIGFSKCSLWFSDDSCLCEEFVISSSAFRGMGRIAIDRFSTLAEVHGCKMIASGNLLNTSDQKIENLYMRKGGFDLKVGQFIKVL